MGEGDTLLNAVIGAVVAVVLSFIPLSPVLGGGVAGYLQRGDRREGAKVGALSGLLVSVPIAVLGFLGVALFVIVPEGTGVASGIVLAVVVFLATLILVSLYTVGLGALGGYLGNYVYYETDVGSGPTTAERAETGR